MSPRPIASWVGVVVSRLVAGFAVGLVALLGIAALMGTRPLAVLSGSMEPTVRTGDVVLAERIRAADLRIGDIVTFSDPERPGRLVTHRVRALRAGGDRLAVTTRGDANTALEHWDAPSEAEVGRVRARIPLLGYLTVRLTTPWLRLAFVTLPALLLGAEALRRIWRKEPAHA